MSSMLDGTDENTPPHSVTASEEILQQAIMEMADRAKTYDSEETGERSMASTVKAFNAFTGLDMTETQGWLFMVCLKAARSTQGAYRADNFVDGAAYFSLYGESAAKDSNA